MAIREDLVASAAQFLQDPSVATSTVESKVAFLQSKNLTQEEVQAALARSSGALPTQPQSHQPPFAPTSYYGGPAGYQAFGWQAPPQSQRPHDPRRDWRDWFVMATVVGGVGYGLYSFGKRYVYPLVAPPTPERLETDKKAVDEQFEKAFVLVDQLAKDTEALKIAEQERTERLDTALADLETVIGELKSANRRREDEAQRVRDEVQNLKSSIPKALDKQKDVTDERLKDVNKELISLKTLLSQRLGSVNGTTSTTPNGSPSPALATSNNVAVPETKDASGSSSGGEKEADSTVAESNMGRTASGRSAASVKIPDWQRAMLTKKAAPSASTAAEEQTA